MHRLGRLTLASAICLVALGLFEATAVAKASPCPTAYGLADLPELEEFVEAAGGVAGAELTDFFDLTDENNNGVICFKTLPEATPYPTPPLLAGDDKVAKT